MPGLDKKIVKNFDFNVALSRIKNDVKSDFILSPHFSAVYTHLGQRLCKDVKSLLFSGKYEAQEPLTIEVPKQSGITRPGSILFPYDRMVYQLLVDYIAPIADKEIDRSRVFSNVLSQTNASLEMFEPSHECWERMQAAIANLCANEEYSYAIKADVSNYFERLCQHNLINLLYKTECSASVVRLLEKLLSVWMEKNSFGIIQGVSPSDFLGNLYLVSIDTDFDVRNIPSVRYVDDLYIFFKNREEARKGLMGLTRLLRYEGLSLNERKTKIVETSELSSEEREVDILFKNAREEIKNKEVSLDISRGYGFQTLWVPASEIMDEKEIELVAVDFLYNSIDDSQPSIVDKIEKFCLPYLAISKSDIAITRSKNGLFEKPHLTQPYLSYLAAIAEDNFDVKLTLEEFIRGDDLPYDWQLMWVIGAILHQKTIDNMTINALIKILADLPRPPALRAIAAIAIGRFGSPSQKRLLRSHYKDETSDYVRGAILYSTRFFPPSERRTLLATWAHNSITNELIADTVKIIVAEK